MEVEDHEVHKKHAKKIRVKIITNRNLQFITSVKPEATISQLANRALSVYLELTGQKLLQSTCKKQLTVSAVKQGVFYMPKSQCVSNILHQDEVVEVIIIKAKPKFPNTVYNNQPQSSKKETNANKRQIPEPMIPEPLLDKKQLVIEQESEEQLQNLQPQVVRQETVTKKVQQTISKRQKKKQKKKQKNQKRKKLLQEKEAKSKESIVNEQLKNSKEREAVIQGLPKKKVKTQKEEFQNSSQKPPQLVIPSPKITFHADPKMDSPRNFALGESQKKKGNFEPINKPQDQQNTKKTPLQKILSPHYSLKSPFLGQKTPINANAVQNSGKQKQKQELLNFTLPRKASEDKRYEPRKDKIDETSNDLKTKKQKIIDTKENSIKIAQPVIQKNKELKQTKGNIISDEEKTTQKVAAVKPTKSLVIVQPPSDSQSEQRKNIDQSIHQNHRFKQLAEINSKIKNFLIESEDDQ